MRFACPSGFVEKKSYFHQMALYSENVVPHL